MTTSQKKKVPSCPTVHHRAALPRNIRRPRFWYLLVASGLFQGCFKVAPHIGFVDVGQWKTFYYKNADPEVAEPSLKWVNRGTQIKLYLWLSTDQHLKWSQAEMKSRSEAQNTAETAANGATG